MAAAIDYKWATAEQFGDLFVAPSTVANVHKLQSLQGGEIIVTGLGLTEYVRNRISAEHCPRCGDFLRGALLSLNLQCEYCDAFDRERLTK
jgi:hypothetical protein